MIDITEKGAALRAASEGRFNELPVHNPDVECCSRERIRAIQLEKLIAQVEWTYERVAWYRDQMDEMGVKPSDIKCLEDVRKLPFTDKHALRKTFPYGMFAVPLDEVVELHSSSGTTGKPIVVGYNRHDMDIWNDCIMRLVQMAGVVPTDRVQMAFGYGMFTGGFGLHYGLQRLACMMIPAGSGNTERQIQMIQDYGTTVLVATPSYAMHICEVGEKMGYDWAKDLEHVAFGMVSYEGRALSTREGYVVYLDELLTRAVEKAREIIEQAQQEKQAVLADAKKRADAEIARREAEADKGRAAIDEEFAQREARESERMDAAYLDAKHALDNAFEAGHDAWLAEITQNTLAAL